MTFQPATRLRDGLSLPRCVRGMVVLHGGQARDLRLVGGQEEAGGGRLPEGCLEGLQVSGLADIEAVECGGGERPGRAEQDAQWVAPLEDPGEAGDGHVDPGGADAAPGVALLVECEC